MIKVQVVMESQRKDRELDFESLRGCGRVQMVIRREIRFVRWGEQLVRKVRSRNHRVLVGIEPNSWGQEQWAWDRSGSLKAEWEAGAGSQVLGGEDSGGTCSHLPFRKTPLAVGRGMDWKEGTGELIKSSWQYSITGDTAPPLLYSKSGGGGVPGPAASAIPGNFLEMQTAVPHPC